MILDWVPAHFPRDEWALARFDGTALYEHADPRRGAHPDWGTLIFNYGRNEVRNFLVANALLLAERVPRRRPARGRRRLDALPRLLAQRRASGCPTSTAGARTSRRSRFLQRAQRGDPRARAGRADGRRGVDRLAGRLAPDVRRRPRASTSSGTWAGCTTRSAYFEHGPGPPPLPPRRADVQPRLRLHASTSCCRSRTTRSCTARARCCRKMPGDDWQQLRQPARALRLHVGAPRQEAAVHGRRARPGAGVEPRARASTGTCSSGAATPACSAWCATSTTLYRDHAGAVGARLRAGRLPLAGGGRRGRQRASPSPASRPRACRW